jgi:hypothetical protein
MSERVVAHVREYRTDPLGLRIDLIADRVVIIVYPNMIPEAPQ